MARPSSPSEEVLYQLVAYFKAQMTELAQVLQDFPDSNIQLQYPTLTITSQQPVFTNLPVVLLASTLPDVNNRSVSQYIVGEYDFRLQLDLWTRNKLERTTLYERIFQVLNPLIDPMGLNLQLSNYYNLWCHYDVVGYAFDDSEAASQRQEWRATIQIVANCKAVLQSTDYAIKTIATTLETPDNIP